LFTSYQHKVRRNIHTEFKVPLIFV